MMIAQTGESDDRRPRRWELSSNNLTSACIARTRCFDGNERHERATPETFSHSRHAMGLWIESGTGSVASQSGAPLVESEFFAKALVLSSPILRPRPAHLCVEMDLLSSCEPPVSPVRVASNLTALAWIAVKARRPGHPNRPKRERSFTEDVPLSCSLPRATALEGRGVVGRTS